MRPAERVSPSLLSTQWLTLRWTRGTRYYRAHLEQDLWLEWVITRVNGRRGTSFGRARTHLQPSLSAALTNLAAIAERREQRGYQLNE
jgi:hypothetical protein